MALIEFPRPLRYTPIAIAILHVLSVIYLSYLVASSIRTSLQALSLAQGTRSLRARRTKFAPVFLFLAALALTVATSTALDAGFLSYSVWANRHGVKVPQRYTLLSFDVSGFGH